MPPAPRSVTAAQRAAEAVRMRKDGRQYDEIGRRFGVSTQRAHQIVTKALDATVQEPADELRSLELARLDQMWVEALKVLRRRHVVVSHGEIVRDDGRPLEDDAPVLHAIDRLLKIQERRARLLGLDAPTQAKVTVISEDAVDAEIRRLEAELVSLDQAGQAPAAP